MILESVIIGIAIIIGFFALGKSLVKVAEIVMQETETEVTEITAEESFTSRGTLEEEIYIRLVEEAEIEKNSMYESDKSVSEKAEVLARKSFLYARAFHENS